MNMQVRQLGIAFACLLTTTLGLADEAPSSEPGEITAATYTPPDFIRSTPPLPDRWSGRKAVSISRHDAIEMALSRNLDLAFQRQSVRIIEQSRARALGGFEPRIRLWGGRSGSQSPPQNIQEGLPGQVYDSTADTWNLSISGMLPSGTQYSLDFLNSRTATEQANAVLPVRYYPTLSLMLRQPLLSGFSFDGSIQMAPLTIARFATEKEREQARLQAMIVVKLTEDAYWTLKEKWKTYEVQRDAQAIAEKQLELTRRQISAGISAPSELLSIKGRAAQVQLEVVRAEADIEDAADTLRRLLNVPAEEWDQPLLPVDQPSFAREVVSFEVAFSRAQAARPELKSSQLDVQQAVLDLKLAQNRRLPQLTVQGAASVVGQDAEYGQALQQLAARSGWQWSAGLDLGWEPLGMKARADIRSQESAKYQRELHRERTLVNIRSELRAALRGLDNAERQVYAAALSRELADRNLDIDHRRFLTGVQGVDNFKLAQRQSEQSSARLQELRALLQHERAQTQLLLAMGELLESRQLKFELATKANQ
jgi:outer membrane protein